MFIKDCWYVAAYSHELAAGELLPRLIIGLPIVLYRTDAGGIVVLEDRCCHRLAPLSKGRIEDGCNLRCMYHGLKFDSDGICIEIPGQDKIPDTARVEKYAVHEAGGWIWVWMGDIETADPALVPPVVGFDHADFDVRGGYMDYEANYQLINDNLTDFSHLSYVHANSFGATEEVAETRPKVERLDRGIRVTRWVSRAAREGKDTVAHRKNSAGAAIFSTYDYLLPGVLLMRSEFHPPEFMPEDRCSFPTTEPLSGTFTSQAVTPMTDQTTRYYYCWGPRRRDSEPGMPEQMMELAQQAFDEDREMIEAQQRIMNLKPGNEVLTTADVGPVQMRSIVRHFLKREAEQADA
ncbi:MAG: aromatic ring-hydroxylating dioxygenase subunit alpha [Novosphingobium sp.]|jgi:phenylpropionate dioxygenase-like ring-hydroxylating dioxygenase large terminal subunit|nr:aromatic ring-hydroxylating dioxygenase subunit alpha [Novosphingobium sp.]